MADIFEILLPVGNNLDNLEEDVFKVKHELYDRDYYKRKPDNGIVDYDLTKGIKAFQKDYALKEDGYMNPEGETTITIRNLWDSYGYKNNKPARSLIRSRKQAVLGNGTADFLIRSDKFLAGNKPIYEFEKYEEVTENMKSIEKQAKLQDVDPDLIKSIIYLETTHGAYDRFRSKPSSIRPMNILTNFWQEFGSYNELDNIDKNIEIGTKLVKRIQEASGIDEVDKIGELYHQLDATKVGDYGSRIKRLYEEKPWNKN